MILGLEREAADPSFWGDNKLAQRKMRELAILKKEVEDWRGIKARTDDLHEFLTIALEEHDDSLAESFEEEYSGITKSLDDLEFKLMLSGEFDERSAMIALHAGAGGVDSQDWVRILMRMYVRWAERRGFKTDVLDVSSGEEGGVKTAIIQVTGDYAYGYLRSERGVHRLVRISPFDGNHARHTSFALAEVMPEVEEGVDVTINPDDLKIDVFRAGGHGGQSVQKNSTAIRITHLPTKVVVTCQNERSQHQNKEIAMRILMARLMEIEMKKRDEELARIRGEHISPEWGNQIRSYVLHPYQMVKDHRTDLSVSNADAVLDGELDEFISTYLSSTVGIGAT
ncbi:MAG: peptide chain release factor 2 [SAR202 cluster bacterium]|nr:peptide chain release factor 2 [Chloroflexota bacterium]MQG58913.1 peptide chain release factor 2 [SAR202 cluster bacterium]MQG69833.1 peptide chain release factor 2 [SAR202 cluster bacterium]HAL48189.1 peptide chain release factor 2 [Dehalococcoidia bacterium]